MNDSVMAQRFQLLIALLSLLRCSVGRCKREQAEMCVKAVLAVADLARKDVNLELIKVGIGCMSLGSFCPKKNPKQ